MDMNEELKNIKWWELKSVEDLILKFYDSFFEYLDLLEGSWWSAYFQLEKFIICIEWN